MTTFIAALAILSLVCALIPTVLFIINLFLYTTPAPVAAGVVLPAVSILIPARNEAHAIADAVRAALSTTGIDLEVIVMDDSSTDGTDEIVRALAALDPRVRLEQAPSLPRGWNGKQHACWALAHGACNPLLCFVDADVRLAPECVSRMAAQLARGHDGRPSSLISGFPRQITGSTLEWMLLPLIHFVLLGFLPIARMRESTAPSLAAGCGQFMLVRAEDYFRTGGHSGIKLTMHDGLRLPRLFREHGLATDLADITELATCRMYTSAAQVWSGLAKNATEGIADPVRIVPISLVLFMGQVLPFMVFAYVLVMSIIVVLAEAIIGLGVFGSLTMATRALAALVASTLIAAWTPRILAVTRFQQDWRSALLHPFGIVLLLCVQWYALTRKLLGGRVSWKDRAYVGE